MKAQCPKCKAVYNIDDSKIPEKGAQATCAKCKTRFNVKRADKRADKAIDKGDKAGEPQVIITCPSCGHVNLTIDKCGQCNAVFTDEDKKKLGIKI
ncbi:zinc-ribbon domain-containing protein [Thermodesulfobacteriota bacterium]